MTKFTAKKILVPVDFSGFSDEAMEAAVGIAQSQGGVITAVHVMVEPQTSVPYEVYVDWQKVKDEIMQDSEKMIDKLIGQFGADLKVEKRLEWGEPTTLIAKLAKEEDFDLIVMATHGRSGLSRLFMGSVAESVIRHSPCPVMVIRSQELKAA